MDNMVDGFDNRLIFDTPGIVVKACPNGGVSITDANGNGIKVQAGGTVITLGAGSFVLNTARVTVNLSNAQLLALAVTPVVILPPPGVGKYYHLITVTLKYTFGTIALVSAGTFALGYGTAVPPGSSVDSTPAGNFLTGTVNGLHLAFPGALNSKLYPTAIDNQQIALGISSAITAGDGTLSVVLDYITETF